MAGAHTTERTSHRRAADAAEQARARRRTIIALAAVLVPIYLAVAVAMIVLWPSGSSGNVNLSAAGYAPGTAFLDATVTKVTPFSCESTGSAPDVSGKIVPVTCAHVTTRLTDGAQATVDVEPATFRSGIHVGDRVQLARFAAAPGQPVAYTFVDFQRSVPMLWLAVAFAVVVIAVARWRGAAALVGLAISFAVLIKFMIPALLDGENPLLVGLVGSAAIVLIVLYLAHGVSIRTTTALIGTLFGLLASAGLGWWAVGAAHLSGVATEDDLTIAAIAGHVRLSGLVLCGVVVASLGILNDVTVTQASAVWELRDLHPKTSERRLFSGAMRIGRDHIASTVYTVAFAYAGAALPVLLLIDVSQQRLSSIVTREALAEEIIRTLAGSIGLVLAVPLTTLAAVALVRATAAEPPATQRQRLRPETMIAKEAPERAGGGGRVGL